MEFEMLILKFILDRMCTNIDKAIVKKMNKALKAELVQSEIKMNYK